MDRSPPLVRTLAPAPGSRAERYGHLLAPDDEAPAEESPPRTPSRIEPPSADLLARLESLEREVARLREALEDLGWHEAP